MQGNNSGWTLNMINTFPLLVSYAQIAVFDANLDKPFNDWNDNHYIQGFSWRKESVSFAVPDGGDCLVEVITAGEVSQFAGETTREIMVPFETQGGLTAFASISDEKTLLIEKGTYQLKFELLPAMEVDSQKFDYGIRLIFTTDNSPVFKIFKADAEMDINAKLDLNATPAN
jgi:Competence protein J (ComJ)